MTLRIQKSPDEGMVVFTLSGRIESEQVAELQRLFDFESEAHSIVLDLKEVKLVDREAVGFLACWEAKGVRLKNCPPYIREWILREKDGV
jgi:anti-anti-sigma regulatory factor